MHLTKRVSSVERCPHHVGHAIEGRSPRGVRCTRRTCAARADRTRGEGQSRNQGLNAAVMTFVVAQTRFPFYTGW